MREREREARGDGGTTGSFAVRRERERGSKASADFASRRLASSPPFVRRSSSSIWPASLCVFRGRKREGDGEGEEEGDARKKFCSPAEKQKNALPVRSLIWPPRSAVVRLPMFPRPKVDRKAMILFVFGAIGKGSKYARSLAGIALQRHLLSPSPPSLSLGG